MILLTSLPIAEPELPGNLGYEAVQKTPSAKRTDRARPSLKKPDYQVWVLG